MAQSTTTSDPSSSTTSQPHTVPFEMSELDRISVVPTSSPPQTSTATASQGLLNHVSIPASSPIDTTFPTTMSSNSNGELPSADTNTVSPISQSSAILLSSDAPSSTNPPPISRLDSITIGPSTETPTPLPSSSEAGPVLVITLLLGTGARHPYKIDERYLTKRNVTVPGVTESGKKDPFSISVYTLKELILREWREEWENKPSSPSSIRLIFFGRLLDDKTPLKECRFNADTANVVHITVRPQDMVDEEDASKAKAGGRDRGEGERTAGCRCVIL